MPMYQVSYHKARKEVRVQNTGANRPAGFVDVGNVELPDPDYPDYLLFHKVRDLLYQRSAANPAVRGMFPDNITDLEHTKIVRDH